MESTSGRRNQTLSTGGAYALLFVLGVMEGLVGCFQFSRSVGPVPVAALAFCALLLVTCVLAGFGLESSAAALAVALGWLVASLVLTLPTPAGSVIVTNTSAGKWYLYGGAVCAALGVMIVFRSRLRQPPADVGAGVGRSPSRPGPGSLPPAGAA